LFVCLFVSLFVCVFVCLPEGALVHFNDISLRVRFQPSPPFPFGQRQTLVRSLRFTDKGSRPSRRSCVCACSCVCSFGSCAYPPFLCAAADARVVLQEHRRPRRGAYPQVPLEYSRVTLEYSRVPLEYPSSTLGNSTRASAPTQRRVGLSAAVSTAPRALEESRVPSSTLGSPRVRGTLMCAFLRFGRCVHNRP
jgi:hypothetical protein